MSKDYCWKSEKLADILMTLAAIPCVDELSEDTLREFKDELIRVDALVDDLGEALIKALDENEMLKERITELAERIN
jgi:hypothetical protein|tara:strand:+ start:224 stop:454 length:231 start_codon:yes stop_codon:yes gene_type:complete